MTRQLHEDAKMQPLYMVVPDGNGTKHKVTVYLNPAFWDRLWLTAKESGFSYVQHYADYLLRKRYTSAGLPYTVENLKKEADARSLTRVSRCMRELLIECFHGQLGSH